jgi:phenylacetate-coenzyme A ligase PaaK-like adenylate-forming protein
MEMNRRDLHSLIRHPHPYDYLGTDEAFWRAMKANALAQAKGCPDYARILEEAHFDPSSIQSMDDLKNLPVLPTLYFKHHELTSMPNWKLLIKATSSGTSSGIKSKLGFDLPSLLRGAKMVYRLFHYHHLWSFRPVIYCVFGYEPHKDNQVVIAKSTYGFTFLTPARKRVYALHWSKEGYQLDLEGMKQALIEADAKQIPVRTAGFPAYTYFLLQQMQQEGLHLHLPKGSKVTVGGGWKQFYTEQVEKASFYQLVEEVLGIPEADCVEFFSAVEHPILYIDCRHHHFHVPIYSRIIIRDPDTLEPLPPGQVGLVNLLTPLVGSAPLLSVMTDDLGILHTEGCPCGETSPWLEILGRVGVADVVTCAQGAEALFKKGEEAE